MNVLERLDEQFAHYKQRHRDIVYGMRDEHMDDFHEEYEAETRRVFTNLTPDERQEIFQIMLQDFKNELEDCFVENYTDEVMKGLILVQIFEQLVQKE